MSDLLPDNPPTPENGYTVSSTMEMTAALWNHVLGSIHDRLAAREALEADFEDLISTGTSAALTMVQENIAPQLVALQVSIGEAQGVLDQMLAGTAPNADRLGGKLPAWYVDPENFSVSAEIKELLGVADAADARAALGLSYADETAQEAFRAAIGAFAAAGGTIGGATDIEGLLRIALKAGMAGKGIIVSGKAAAGASDEGDLHGLLIALANNVAGNRQLFFGNSESLIGIRVTNGLIDAYNLGTAARLMLTLGTETHGSLLLGPVEARHQLTVTGSLVVPRLTTTQRDALASAAVEGTFIYNIDVGDLQVYDGWNWQTVTPIGSGQTWQNVTSIRSTGTNYVNNTGRTIAMSLTLGSSGTMYSVDILINGQTVVPWTGQQQRTQLYIEVPPGATYRVNATLAGINNWWELRA